MASRTLLGDSLNDLVCSIGPGSPGGENRGCDQDGYSHIKLGPYVETPAMVSTHWMMNWDYVDKVLSTVPGMWSVLSTC